MPISRKNILTAGFGALSLMAAVAMAQEQVQRYQANKPVVGNTNAAINSTNYTDSQFAGVLIVDNQGEIALGKLAEQKSGNKDIKQFAQMMVKDHTDFMQQLEKFARTQGQNAYSGANMPQATGIQQQASGNTDQALPGATTQPMGGQNLNFVQLKQEIGQKILQMTQQDLEQKSGSEFDKCYIGGQVGAHVAVLATLEVFRNQASPELASVLDKGIETTKTHLEHAKQIAQSLER